MEGAHIDCPVSIDHEVAGVICNSCTNGVCAFSERETYGEGRMCWEQGVFNRSCEEEKTTLTTSLAEDYSETDENRARLTPEV